MRQPPLNEAEWLYYVLIWKGCGKGDHGINAEFSQILKSKDNIYQIGQGQALQGSFWLYFTAVSHNQFSYITFDPSHVQSQSVLFLPYRFEQNLSWISNIWRLSSYVVDSLQLFWFLIVFINPMVY